MEEASEQRESERHEIEPEIELHTEPEQHSPPLLEQQSPPRLDQHSPPALDSQQVYLYQYSLNQDQSCFSISTTADFRTFSMHPSLVEVSRRRIQDQPPFQGPMTKTAPSPINMSSMLFQTNYLGLVSRANPYKVLLWDDSLAQPPFEIWSRFEVLNVLLRRDVICVVSEYKIYVYEMGNQFSVLLHLETVGNPRGVAAISPGGVSWVLVCPGKAKGSVRIQIGLDDSISNTVVPHSNSIACVAVNLNGTLAATASELGTVIKIYNTLTAQVVYELRRGTVSTTISCMTFRKDGKFLVVGSANPTVHIFKLADSGASASQRQHAAQQMLGRVADWVASASGAAGPTGSADSVSTGSDKPSPSIPRYFQSSRSYASFRIPDFESSSNSQSMDLRTQGSPICGPLVAFSTECPNRVVITHFNGLLYEIQFDEQKPDFGQDCLFLGAVAYFQARPDFAVSAGDRFTAPTSVAAPGSAPDTGGDNWQLI